MKADRGRLIQLTRVLQVEPRRAFDVVYDVENFPSFMSNVSAVDVVSDDGRCKIVKWGMVIDGAPLDWTEEIIYDHDRLTAQFKALDGVFLRFDGLWRVQPGEGGAQLDLELSYDLGLPEIEDIVGPILDERLRRNLDAMLENIQARAALQ